MDQEYENAGGAFELFAFDANSVDRTLCDPLWIVYWIAL